MAHLEYENIQTTSLRTPPTYLKELGIEDQDILLVHLKVKLLLNNIFENIVVGTYKREKGVKIYK